MVVSIVLKGMHSIGLDDKGRFKHGENVISMDEVPYIRYRFPKFGAEEIDYIKAMQDKFYRSTHLAEMTLSSSVIDEFALTEGIDCLARYIYIPVTEADVNAKTLSLETQELLIDIAEADLLYDRLMLLDVDKVFYSRVFNSFRDKVSEICDVKAEDVGACSSPMSFNGDACLTAVRARELSSEYSGDYIGKTPSSNHECMNTCGCIKYIVVDKDIKASICTSTKSSSGGSAKAPKVLPRLLQNRGNALSTLSGSAPVSPVPKSPVNVSHATTPTGIVTQQPSIMPNQLSFHGSSGALEVNGEVVVNVTPLPTVSVEALYAVPQVISTEELRVEAVLPSPVCTEDTSCENSGTSCETTSQLITPENMPITIGGDSMEGSVAVSELIPNDVMPSIPVITTIPMENVGQAVEITEAPMVPSAAVMETFSGINFNSI